MNFIMSEKVISILWGISFWSLLSYLWIDWETLSIFAVVLFLDFFFWIIDVYLFDKSLITSKKAWRWLLNKITKLLLPMIVVIVLKWVWFKEMDFLISSIEITPVAADPSGIATVKNEVAKSAIFNLAGQKVNGNFKGIIVKNGKKILK